MPGVGAPTDPQCRARQASVDRGPHAPTPSLGPTPRRWWQHHEMAGHEDASPDEPRGAPVRPGAAMRLRSTTLLQVVTVFIGIGSLALLLWEPHIEGRNAHATLTDIYFRDPFLAYVYLGSIPFFIALYQAFRLLGWAGSREGAVLGSRDQGRTPHQKLHESHRRIHRRGGRHPHVRRRGEATCRFHGPCHDGRLSCDRRIRCRVGTAVARRCRPAVRERPDGVSQPVRHRSRTA